MTENFWERMWYKHCEDMRLHYWAFTNGIRTYEAYLWFGGKYP